MSEHPTLEQKVDRILILLEGTTHQPGAMSRIETLEETLNGTNDSLGVTWKVNFMWRAHIWIIGGIGTIVGSVLTYITTHIK